jgi:hypothetical protein
MPSPTKLLLCCSVIAVAGCGGASASNGPAGAATPSASGRAGAGTAGQLVKVSGTSLTLSTTNGDVSVAYTSATAITTTSTSSPGDIVPGTCVAIVGQKDSTGAVTASTVRLSRPVNGSCAVGRQAGLGGPNGSPRAFPSGGARPSGAPALKPNTAVVSGMVTAVTGTTVTVRTTAGAASSATVPTTLSVTESSPATAADLTLDSCVRAIGRKDAQGVVQATALTIQPANASGSCTFAGGGGFGFGGGRGFGGAVPTPGA